VKITILDEIVRSKRTEVANARRRTPLELLQSRLASAAPVRDFRGAVAAGSRIRLIAEIKKASPSAQILRDDFDPVTIAQIYEDHGAACISVLTDAPYFQGRLDHLTLVHSSVQLPILRKDFVIDEYQVFEARAANADAVLLIAEILDDLTLSQLLDRSREMGMAALVEFHDEVNLARVIASGAGLVGINNRDLRNFRSDIERTLRLRDQIPPEVLVVSESGISTRREVERLQAAGICAILVGESLMRAPDIGLGVDELLGNPPRDRSG
jgi:indole-3-glycerol phosphate synthase